MVGIHSEDVANEPAPAPLVDFLTNDADVSPVTNLFIAYFHRQVDLHKRSQTLM